VGDLRERTRTQLSEPQAQYILSCTLRALVYLHSRNIVHRDIKASNVLITKAGEVKLADFGVSKQVIEHSPVGTTSDSKGSHVIYASSAQASVLCGSPLWMAPETILGAQSMAADIWALGITACEISEGEPPRTDLAVEDLLRTIVTGPSPGLNFAFWSQSFRDFIANCLIKEESKRPTALQLCEHPFIRGAPQKRVLVPVIKRFFHLPKQKHLDFTGSFDLLRSTPSYLNDVPIVDVKLPQNKYV